MGYKEKFNHYLSIDLNKIIFYYKRMDIFYALGEPTRRSIIEILALHGQLAASEISSKFTVSAAAISQHLKVLKDARLVKVEKRAQQRLYTINPESMIEIEDWAKKMHQMLNNRFVAFDKLIEEEKKKLK